MKVLKTFKILALLSMFVVFADVMPGCVSKKNNPKDTEIAKVFETTGEGKRAQF